LLCADEEHEDGKHFRTRQKQAKSEAMKALATLSKWVSVQINTGKLGIALESSGLLLPVELVVSLPRLVYARLSSMLTANRLLSGWI
jgi:hypothetical protein